MGSASSTDELEQDHSCSVGLRQPQEAAGCRIAERCGEDTGLPAAAGVSFLLSAEQQGVC